jgi:hypothetical protein
MTKLTLVLLTVQNKVSYEHILFSQSEKQTYFNPLNMKLNKNFIQISVTALISSGASILFMASAKHEFSSIPFAPSETISWETATKFRSDYVDFKPLYVRYDDSQGRELILPLEGFVFEKAHLNEIINDNHSIYGNPDKVAFLLGQEDTFKHGSGLFDPKRGNIRMIAVGIKDSKYLIDARSGMQPSIYDKADPCPPNCPR